MREIAQEIRYILENVLFLIHLYFVIHLYIFAVPIYKMNKSRLQMYLTQHKFPFRYK